MQSRGQSRGSQGYLDTKLPAKVFLNVQGVSNAEAGAVNISFAGEHLDSTKKDTYEDDPQLQMQEGQAPCQVEFAVMQNEQDGTINVQTI